jgi:DNA topoisomerase 2-associated protein PAT1
LGKVTRGNASAPRPVLAVPGAGSKDARPAVAALNQQSGIHRRALTKKQVMYALEELYDSVLELEQMRRQMPSVEDQERIELWNSECSEKVDIIWRRLMVMEPLDVRCVMPPTHLDQKDGTDKSPCL